VKYALLMFTDPAQTKAMSADEIAEILTKHEALRERLARSGELLNGAGLVLPEDTTVLRLAPDGVIATRGPLSAADEHMTGTTWSTATALNERGRSPNARSTVTCWRSSFARFHDSSGF
jgi:hypothetical protein